MDAGIRGHHGPLARVLARPIRPVRMPTQPQAAEYYTGWGHGSAHSIVRSGINARTGWI